MHSYETEGFDEPAPTIQVQLMQPDRNNEPQDCFGQLDTGAGLSAFPSEFIKILKLTPMGDVPLIGWDNKKTNEPCYLLNVCLDKKHCFNNVLAVATSADLMLIGRDILNKMDILLEGPNLRWHIIK